MHAAQRALGFVERNIGLRNDWLSAVIRELVLAECSSKETSTVFATFDVDDERAFKLHFRKDHDLVTA